MNKPNKITSRQVMEMLIAWQVRYAESGRTVKQVQAMAPEWLEDLQNLVTPGLFDATMREVRRSCKFFPQVKDVVDAFGRVSLDHQQTSDLVQLPEHIPFTDEEVSRNVKRLDILKRMVTGEFTEEQGHIAMAKLIKPAGAAAMAQGTV